MKTADDVIKKVEMWKLHASTFHQKQFNEK